MSRFVDRVLLVLFCYYLWSCVFIERHYCAEPIGTHSEGLLKTTYEYSKQYNPLFAERPEWLRLATCFSAYGLGVGEKDFSIDLTLH